MKLALIQMEVEEGKSGNIDRARRLVEQAAAQDCDMAVLPEMFCCPYSNRFFASYAEEAGGQVWRALSDTARRNDIWLVAGSMPERQGEQVYNTSFVFDRTGAQAARHRKMHLFDIDVRGGQRFFESETFTGGDEVTVFATEFGKIGLCICFDLRFPELARLMALRGAQMIICPAAFNMTTGPRHWELMFRQRAVDNQLFTAGAAPARDENGVYVSYGNSIVCSPWGDVLARAGAAPELMTAEVDFARNDEVRCQLPLLSARRCDRYELRERE